MKIDLPYMRFYVERFRSATATWTDEEVGAYLRLLMHEWVEGPLPADPARLVRVADTVQENWDRLRDKFVERPGRNGSAVMINERLEEERETAMLRYLRYMKASGLGVLKRKRQAGLISKVEYDEQVRAIEGLTDGATDGRTVGATDGLTDGRTDGSTDGATVGSPTHSESESKSKRESDSDSTTSPPPPSRRAREAPKTEQQGRVDQVLQLLPELKPGMAARWLKEWAEHGDLQMLAALEGIREDYPDKPPSYIGQVLRTALKAGGTYTSTLPDKARSRDREATQKRRGVGGDDRRKERARSLDRGDG